MTDEQIKILLRLTGDDAKALLDQGESILYKGIQDQMVELVREHGVQLPLNCLQFHYYVNGYSWKPDRYSSMEVPF